MAIKTLMNDVSNGAYVEAPVSWDGEGASVFLGGGISGCGDWQRELAAALDGAGLTLLNPRRSEFDVADVHAAEAQIEWEHRHLRRASAVLFWFPCETLCPITLYELGAWSMAQKPLFIGVHPGYARRFDVCVQTRLQRPEVTIVDSLASLAAQVRAWAASLHH
jgi:hypothetical protein